MSETSDARAAGILLHPTSLPGPHGIGDLGASADRFLDWAAAAGQTLWQVLPLGPTGGGSSPYTSASAFAGNPLLISPQRLVEDGFLQPEALEHAPQFPGQRVDFAAVRDWKEHVLRLSWEQFGHLGLPAQRDALSEFRDAPGQAAWLEDWCRFAALKAYFSGRPWTEWGPDLAFRDADALAAADTTLGEEMDYERYVQFLFFRQWERVRRAARERGVSVVGDIPIYVAHDSADVWARQDLFQLDATGRPTAIAGVPPDYFSATGQLWGNPLYRWDVLKDEGYAWWIARIRSCLAALRPAAHRPFPRVLRLLVRSGDGEDGARRPMGAGPRPRALRRRARRARPAADPRRRPRRHRRRRAGAARRARLSRHEDPAVRVLRLRQPVPAAPLSEEQRRLHGHARQRHRARLVRRAQARGARARLGLPRLRRPRGRVVPDPRGLRFRRGARDRPAAGRPRPRQRSAHEQPGAARGQLGVARPGGRISTRSSPRACGGWRNCPGGWQRVRRNLRPQRAEGDRTGQEHRMDPRQPPETEAPSTFSSDSRR